MWIAATVVAIGAGSSGSSALAVTTTLYDNTASPRKFSPGDALPLSGGTLDAGHVLWDDVPINIGANVGQSVDVKRVTFDILRGAGAPAVNLEFYWAPLVADNGPNRGSNTSVPFDGSMDDPGTPTIIGSLSLPANPGAATRLSVPVGDGLATIFNTGALNSTTYDYDPDLDFYFDNLHPGYGYFMLGIKFSNTDPRNGWTLADDLNNLTLSTEGFLDMADTVDEFYYLDDSAGVPIRGTNMMIVEGEVVPEPAGAVALLALAGGAALLRSRRRA
jgi:hypothetical protein